MLILFDIDGTLIRTDGAGRRALELAGRRLYGEAFRIDAVPISGRLDPTILADCLDANGIDAAECARYRETYLDLLDEVLAAGPTREILPGVTALVAALHGRAGVTLGLLTGNFQRSGRLKLAACGLDDGAFTVNAFADDAEHARPERTHLPPIALARYRAMIGRELAAGDAVVIGDTVQDVLCARAHGCRSLAVLTGGVPAAALRDAGADRVVADLADTAGILDFLLRPLAARGRS